MLDRIGVSGAPSVFTQAVAGGTSPGGGRLTSSPSGPLVRGSPESQTLLLRLHRSVGVSGAGHGGRGRGGFSQNHIEVVGGVDEDVKGMIDNTRDCWEEESE